MSKIFSLNKIPFSPNSVTLVCGYYDLLHAGHVRFLEECKNVGNRLVVGVLSDRICEKVKGSMRPVVKDKDRAFIISKLDFVDCVFICDYFYADNNGYLIKKIKPKVVVFSSGEKSRREKSAEELYLKSKKPEIKIVYIPRQRSDISTTDLIKKIQSLPNHVKKI